MPQYAPLVLPPWTLRQSNVTIFETSNWPMPWTGYAVKGATFTGANGPGALLTPVLYHKGSVRANNGQNGNGSLDPEDTATVRPNGDNVLATQYGIGYGDQYSIVRRPRALLFNQDIWPPSVNQNPQASQGGADGASDNTVLGYVDGIVSAMSANLIRNNVLTAGYMNNIGNPEDYIAWAFPQKSYDAWAVPVIAQNKRNVDATQFEGGELLVLFGTYLNENNASFVGYNNYFGKFNASAPLVTDTQNIDWDIASLTASRLKFSRLKIYVYFRRYDGSADQTTVANAIKNATWAYESQLAAQDLVLRGPYDHLADITSIVQADIAAFYP